MRRSERTVWFGNDAGSLKVVLSVNIAKLDDNERRLVFGIVDAVQELEREARDGGTPVEAREQR